VLAPFIDARKILLEGTVTGDRGPFDIPITIDVLAHDHETLSILCSQLRAKGVPLDMSRLIYPPVMISATSTIGPTFILPYYQVPVNIPRWHNLIKGSSVYDHRASKEALDKIGLSVQDLEKIPLAKQPATVKTKMLPYQLQGLHWLLDKEHPKLPGPGETKQFWKKDKDGLWYNIATK
jgi:SWI/SNF-related matrix-associated actin-dependent regulator of chromatin subfamily A3